MQSVPGVFLNGLLVTSPNGTVLYERTMERAVVASVSAKCRALDPVDGNSALLGFVGDVIVAERRAPITDSLTARYNEPEVVICPDMSDSPSPVHKLLYMAEPDAITRIRPALEAHCAGRATLVQALPEMLEFLPLGASKGDGVRRLLETLDVPYRDILAVGDAENDIGMLQAAGVGVAMGQAADEVKAAADWVTSSRDEDGFVAALRRFVG